MNNKRKSLFNLIFGVSNQVIVLVIGLIVPRMFITSFGSATNGIQSSIAYLYTYVSLLESGIGAATLQALYHCVGVGDKAGINAILSATKKQYQKISLYFLLCMIGMALIFPFTVNSSLPKTTIALMTFLSGITTLTNFLAYGKFVILLQADGRSYIVMIVNLVSYIGRNAVKIIFLAKGMSIVSIYLAELIIPIFVVVFYEIYKRKYFSWVSYREKPNFAAISQSKNVLVHQISNIICNSTDVLVLTYVVRDLALVSVYNLYCMIFDAVKTLIINVFSSVHFIMGQTYNTDVIAYRRLHHVYEVSDFFVSFSLYSVAYVMILPFMRIYTNGIFDVNYIDGTLALMFVIVKLLSSLREPAAQLINYAGHFKKTQIRSIIETGLNLGISIVASMFIGIYGVLLGTIVALTYRMLDMHEYTSRLFLDRSILESLRLCLIYGAGFTGVVIANRYITIPADTFIEFFAYAIPVVLIMAVYYGVITIIFNHGILRNIMSMFRKGV